MDKPYDKLSTKEQNAQDKLGLEAVADMCTAALKQFEKIDSDGNGFLSKLELEDAANGNKFSLLERKQFRLLAKHSDDIQTVAHNTWNILADTHGIHRRDLSGLKRMLMPRFEKIESLRTLRDVIRQNIQNIDTDGNGEISNVEFGAALKSQSIEPKDRVVLNEASRSWNSISYPQNRRRATSVDFINQIINGYTDRAGGTGRNQATMWALADAMTGR